MRQLLALTIALAATVAVGSDDPSKADMERLFAVKVLPLLEHKCFGCHGADEDDVRGDLDMRTLAGLLKGGESEEPALVPGKPAESPLVSAVKWDELEMPPKETDRLTAKEIALVEAWVKAGAPWPDAERRSEILLAERSKKVTEDGVIVETSGGLSDDWTYRRYQPEDLWAYQPVGEVSVPMIEGAGPNPVDAFVLRKLAEAELQPAERADDRTWLRRVTFDLTGLPPTPEEVTHFLADDSGDARAKVVDRLLDSPRYGERMAQHWLDVARYADTAGFSNDWERPHAWRYRDYVIRAFNDDKPYDQFVREQIAGDEIAPNDPEARIATGFLRMGPWEHTGMSVAAVTRQLFLDDVTNSVGETFLAHGLRCAKCHDHKFDPIPTRDYYGIQAAFATTKFDEPNTPFLSQENTADFDRLREWTEQRKATSDWMRTEDKGNNSVGRLKKKRGDYLKREADRIAPKSLAVKSQGGDKVHILVGGALESPGAMVSPSVLTAVSLDDQPYDVPTSTAGRRTALANWIADERNPLTARVMVNRIWQTHFGRGLVATPNNFGKMGSKPTHPELLDYLARRFVEEGWSVKKLHRLIVTSETYGRRSSHDDMDHVREVDPNNELLAYFPPRRLSAEELRDSMLAVTGELHATMGGPGIFPEINWEVALQPRHIMGSIAPGYVPSPLKEDRHRRTVYAFRIRTLGDPMLEVFNKPGPDASCERRDETTVTPQVFALFNGATVHARSLALAKRLAEEREETNGRIALAYRLLFGRTPTADESAACRAHVERMTAHHEKHEPVRTELPKWVAREMIDEQTGKPFRWSERLEGIENYERDLQPWEVSAEVRGLAELCLVLLNSNEFVYVY